MLARQKKLKTQCHEGNIGHKSFQLEDSRRLCRLLKAQKKYWYFFPVVGTFVVSKLFYQ